MTPPRRVIADIAEVNPRLPAGLASDLSRDVDFVPMADLSEDGVVRANETRPLRDVIKGYTYFENGDVVVAKITPCMENGKAAYVDNLRCGVGFGSTEFHVLRPGRDVCGQYLFWMIWGRHFRQSAQANMTGSAGQKRVPSGFFGRYEIPVPALAEQKRIAAVLDAANSLRVKRRVAIEQLDSLVKATFLEMFGDPATNPKGFPSRSLPEFYIDPNEGTKCGPFGSALKKEEYVQAGVPVWNMDNISPQGRMVMPFRMWVTAEKYLELEAYAVHDGDVLISRAGTVGKMCVANTGGVKSILSTNLIRVRLGRNLLPLYFVSLMTYCKGRVGRLEAGPDGAFTHMSTKVLDTLTFPYPPLELQTRFAAIVQSIEQQRARLKAHLAELDTLFASLQSRAFSGELCTSPVSRQHASA